MSVIEGPGRMKVRVRQDAAFAVTCLTPTILRAMLLERECLLTETHELQLDGGGPWHAVTASPELVPWEGILERAICFLAEGDAPGARLFARRLLALDPDEQQPVTASANLILGYLEQLLASPRARSYYEHALAGPSSVRAAAYSNMGVDDVVRTRDAASAEHDFIQAIASDPAFLPGYINQARFRKLLALEQSAPLPGERPWADLAEESQRRLQQLAPLGASRFLQSGFPGSICIQLVPESLGPPPLGLRLPPAETGLDAGRETLDRAVNAERTGRYATAILLADTAAAECASLGPATAFVRRAATAHQERHQRLAVARRRAELLEDFDHELAAARWEAAEEALVELAAVLPETNCQQLASRRNQAIAEHYRRRARESGNQQATARFYSLAAQTADQKGRDACERMEALVGLRGVRRRFREACEDGRWIRAGKMLIRLRVGGALPGLLTGTMKLWEALKHLARNHAKRSSPAEALFAQAEEQLRQGRLAEADDRVAELRTAAPDEPLVTDLDHRLSAAKYLAAAIEQQRQGNLKEARTSLEACLDLEPTNAPALAWLADSEVTERFGRSSKYFHLMPIVQRAIQEMRCRQYADLARSLKELEELSSTRIYPLLSQTLPGGRRSSVTD